MINYFNLSQDFSLADTNTLYRLYRFKTLNRFNHVLFFVNIFFPSSVVWHSEGSFNSTTIPFTIIVFGNFIPTLEVSKFDFVSSRIEKNSIVVLKNYIKIFEAFKMLSLNNSAYATKKRNNLDLSFIKTQHVYLWETLSFPLFLRDFCSASRSF